LGWRLTGKNAHPRRALIDVIEQRQCVSAECLRDGRVVRLAGASLDDFHRGINALQALKDLRILCDKDHPSRDLHGITADVLRHPTPVPPFERVPQCSTYRCVHAEALGQELGYLAAGAELSFRAQLCGRASCDGQHPASQPSSSAEIAHAQSKHVGRIARIDHCQRALALISSPKSSEASWAWPVQPTQRSSAV
jgi:hypothetical protein